MLSVQEDKEISSGFLPVRTKIEKAGSVPALGTENNWPKSGEFFQFCATARNYWNSLFISWCFSDDEQSKFNTDELSCYVLFGIIIVLTSPQLSSLTRSQSTSVMPNPYQIFLTAGRKVNFSYHLWVVCLCWGLPYSSLLPDQPLMLSSFCYQAFY